MKLVTIIPEYDYATIKGKCHLIDQIMFYVNRIPAVKKAIQKDLPKWDGDPGTLNNALLKIRAYPLVKAIHKKVEDFAKLSLMDNNK